MKKSYIIGAMTLLVVISGGAVVHEYSPKAKDQKEIHYDKDKNYKKSY